MQISPTPPNPPRPRSFLIAMVAGLWIFASASLSARAAQGLTTQFNLSSIESPLQQLIWLFLLLLGFAALGNTARLPGLRLANNLPARTSARSEWLNGVTFGWAMALVVATPLMLLGAFHPDFTFTLASCIGGLISLAALFLATLGMEVAFRGFLFTSLSHAFGRPAAAALLALAFAALSLAQPNASILSFVVTFVAGLLLTLARLRTNALWLGWGLHFAWGAISGVALGLAVSGDASYLGPVSNYAQGRSWLTGGPYGLEASAITLVVLLLAFPWLYRITRDYAWQYTHPPIVAAGVPVVIAPPAAHTAMEEAAAARPAPLVQILSTTPTAVSTSSAVEEHLRGNPQRIADETTNETA